MAVAYNSMALIGSICIVFENSWRSVTLAGSSISIRYKRILSSLKVLHNRRCDAIEVQTRSRDQLPKIAIYYKHLRCIARIHSAYTIETTRLVPLIVIWRVVECSGLSGCINLLCDNFAANERLILIYIGHMYNRLVNRNWTYLVQTLPTSWPLYVTFWLLPVSTAMASTKMLLPIVFSLTALMYRDRH